METESDSMFQSNKADGVKAAALSAPAFADLFLLKDADGEVISA